MSIILAQTLNPGRSRYTVPYDSTVGVGPGFYWFAAGFLLFIVLGTLKAYRDDKKWEGKFIKMIARGQKKAKDSNELVIRRDSRRDIRSKKRIT